MKPGDDVIPRNERERDIYYAGFDTGANFMEETFQNRLATAQARLADAYAEVLESLVAAIKRRLGGK